MTNLPEPPIELLPCPFCGYNEPSSPHYDKDDELWVICCGGFDCCTMTYANSEPTVIERWNTRATDSRLEVAIGALTEASLVLPKGMALKSVEYALATLTGKDGI